MSNQNHLSRGTKPYQYYYYRCIIPKDLREILGKSVFIDYLITCLPKNGNGEKKYGSFLEFQIDYITHLYKV